MIEEYAKGLQAETSEDNRPQPICTFANLSAIHTSNNLISKDTRSGHGK